MKIMDFTIDINTLSLIIKEKGWKRVGLQFPEGLKPYTKEVIQSLTEKLLPASIEFLVSGSPCYGACDVSDNEFLLGKADGMIHFGHSEIPNMGKSYLIPVVFQEMPSEILVQPVVKEVLNQGLLSGIIGLTTTIQFIHELSAANELLSAAGFDVRMGTGTDRLAYPGQVLGCSFSSATAVPQADMYLFVGEGLFHPLGITLATGKPVIAADPRSGLVKNMDAKKDKVLRQRYGAIQKLKDAREIGVVLSTLPGQMRRPLATSLIKKGGDHGKRMTMITTPHLNPMSLMNLGNKVLVSTACPRVAVDDYSLYLEHGITMATPIEFLISIGEMNWDNYVLDTIE